MVWLLPISKLLKFCLLHNLLHSELWNWFAARLRFGVKGLKKWLKLRH